MIFCLFFELFRNKPTQIVLIHIVQTFSSGVVWIFGLISGKWTLFLGSFQKKKHIFGLLEVKNWWLIIFETTIQICINFGNLFAFWWKKSEEGPKKILAPQVSNFWWPLLLFSWPEDFLACRTLRYFLIPLPKSPFRPNRAKIDWIRDNFWIVAFPSKISWNFWGL